jgi:hypothetical protein
MRDLTPKHIQKLSAAEQSHIEGYQAFHAPSRYTDATKRFSKTLAVHPIHFVRNNTVLTDISISFRIHCQKEILGLVLYP